MVTFTILKQKHFSKIESLLLLIGNESFVMSVILVIGVTVFAMLDGVYDLITFMQWGH